MSEIMVNKAEALKIFQLFDECNHETGWQNNLTTFIRDKAEVKCRMWTSGGHYGHVNTSVVIDIDGVSFTQRHYGGQDLRLGDINLQLKENDPRILPAIVMHNSLVTQGVGSDYIKRYMKPYFEGKRTLEQLIAITTKRQEQNKALDAAFVVETAKTKEYVGWSHVSTDVKKKYYSGKMTVDEVVRTAKLYKMTQGR